MRNARMGVVIGTTLLASLALGGGVAVGQVAEGIEYEELGQSWHEALGDDSVRAGRIVMQPGAHLPMSEFSGQWNVRIDSGLLDVTGSMGSLQVDDSLGLAYVVNDDDTLRVRAGSLLSFDDGITMSWSNPGDEPTMLMTMAIIDEDDEPILSVEEAEARRREARVEPLQAEVVRRIVLREPGSRVCEHRLTIRDRSGRLIDARIPGGDELRFVAPLLDRIGNDFQTGVMVSPVVPSGRGRAVLVSWIGSDCGPTALIDIGRDVSAIRVENTCHCDSAGAVHSVLLRLRGFPTDIDDIEAFVQGWD